MSHVGSQFSRSSVEQQGNCGRCFCTLLVKQEALRFQAQARTDDSKRLLCLTLPCCLIPHNCTRYSSTVAILGAAPLCTLYLACIHDQRLFIKMDECHDPKTSVTS